MSLKIVFVSHSTTFDNEKNAPRAGMMFCYPNWEKNKLKN